MNRKKQEKEFGISEYDDNVMMIKVVSNKMHNLNIDYKIAKIDDIGIILGLIFWKSCGFQKYDRYPMVGENKE